MRNLLILLIEAINLEQQRLRHVEVSLLRRYGNSVPHWLARNAKEFYDEVIWIEDPPDRAR